MTVSSLENAHTTLQAQLAQTKVAEEDKARSLSLKTDDHARERAAWARDAEDLDRERRERLKAEREVTDLHDQLHRKKNEIRDLEETHNDDRRKHDKHVEAITEEARVDKKRLEKEITVLKEELNDEITGRKRERDEAEALKVSPHSVCAPIFERPLTPSPFPMTPHL